MGFPRACSKEGQDIARVSFFGRVGRVGVSTSRSNHQSLIGYKNNFYPIRSRRGVDKNAGKMAAAGRKGRKAKKEKTFIVAKQL